MPLCHPNRRINNIVIQDYLALLAPMRWSTSRSSEDFFFFLSGWLDESLSLLTLVLDLHYHTASLRRVSFWWVPLIILNSRTAVSQTLPWRMGALLIYVGWNLVFLQCFLFCFTTCVAEFGPDWVIPFWKILTTATKLGLRWIIL